MKEFVNKYYGRITGICLWLVVLIAIFVQYFKLSENIGLTIAGLAGLISVATYLYHNGGRD